jgi:hypothetical protein
MAAGKQQKTQLTAAGYYPQAVLQQLAVALEAVKQPAASSSSSSSSIGGHVGCLAPAVAAACAFV